VRLRTSEDVSGRVGGGGIGGWRQTPPHAAGERSSCAQKDGEDRSREAQRQRGEWRTDYPYGRILGLGYSRAVGHTIRHAWALRHS